MKRMILILVLLATPALAGSLINVSPGNDVEVSPAYRLYHLPCSNEWMPVSGNIAVSESFAATFFWGDVAISNVSVRTVVTTNTETEACVIDKWVPAGDVLMLSSGIKTRPYIKDKGTEKKVTTTLTETKVYRFHLDGVPEIIVRKKILSTEVKRYRKKEVWEEIK